jgi:DNA-binding NtrC family response regulator
MTPERPPRILVVDDEANICRTVQRILARSGAQVETALNGQEALDLLAARPFDAVLTDLKMSRLGGMEFLRRAKALYPGIPVIVMTGYASVSSAVEVMKLGAVDYVPKPFTPEEIRAVVSQALGRSGGRGSAPPGRAATHQLIGDSAPIRQVTSMVAKVAPTDATVLICGESGTGKELIARAIHANSRRSDRVFFAVDCATLSANLLESELFGHARGAFTGADRDKEGIFQLADGGTVFLDEIGNIGIDVQGKLLRFLETREFWRLGGSAPIRVDVRLIFATNKNLAELVAAGSFREDFYYRIFVYPILLPPLRERRGDILPIARHFLGLYGRKLNKPSLRLDPQAAARLEEYGWPGNVRELRNVIERAAIQCEGGEITPADLGLPAAAPLGIEGAALPPPLTNAELKRVKREIRRTAVDEIERQFLLRALAESGGNITRAARQTGLQRTSFQSLMKKHGIRPLQAAAGDHEDDSSG